MEQNGTDYKPTAAEKRLLEVLLNPENRWKSITAICDIAKCSRKAYYRAFAKPAFTAYYKEESRRLVEREIAPLVHTFVQQAKGGSFQHGKVLLEMADMYQEKSRTELTGKDGGPLQYTDVSLLTPEERRARIDELIRKREAGTPDPAGDGAAGEA